MQHFPLEVNNYLTGRHGVTHHKKRLSNFYSSLSENIWILRRKVGYVGGTPRIRAALDKGVFWFVEARGPIQLATVRSPPLRSGQLDHDSLPAHTQYCRLVIQTFRSKIRKQTSVKQYTPGRNKCQSTGGLCSCVGFSRRNLLKSRFFSFNPLKTKRRLLYLKTQFVPRSKHYSTRL